MLAQKLDERGVVYEKVFDEETMIQKGFTSAPMLEVDGNVMRPQQAFQWINSIKE